MNRLWIRFMIVVAGLFAPAVAAAAPLSFTELGSLETYVGCRELCAAGRKADLATCNAQCPASNAAWEKNQVAPIDRTDLDLARLEYWDEGRQDAICYQASAVVPKSKCDLTDCLRNHTTAQCADQDGDGLRAWQEALIGTSDSNGTDKQKTCNTALDCNPQQFAFKKQCTLKREIGASICEDHATAFHLELKELNDQEVLAYVYFDYAPTPTAILDLYLNYDPSALQLTDSRPLKALKDAGKELAVRQVSGSDPTSGTLRVIAFSGTSSAPIRPGPVAELLFRRLKGGSSTIAFSTDDDRQTRSMAAAPGADYRNQLADDSLWGPGIDVRDGANRLVLQYSFDNPKRPLSYSAVPTGAELCEKVGECKSLDPDAPATKARRAKKVAALDSLQRGLTLIDTQTDGVSSSAAVFDGSASHLELPTSVNLVNNRFDRINQQYSFSTWFYAEAGAGSDPRQLIFSHNAFNEKTALGLYAKPSTVADSVDLVWFSGDFRAPVRSVTVATGISTRKWTHVGLSGDPRTGVVNVFINGEPVSPITGVAADSIFACPVVDPENAERVKMHTEGDLEGGRAPEVLFYARADNNIYGIEQMDMRSFTRRSVINLAEGSAEAPSYSPIVDKIVYSSNAGGNYEIWLANGDGSNPRAITTGFGDTGRRIFARRPKWAPDASAIIFESNAFSLEADDNTLARTYHLYYVPFDATKNEVSIPLPTGSTTNTLDYESLARAGRGPFDASTGRQPNELDRFRVKPPSAMNELDALWVKGPFTETGGTNRRGVILFTSADVNMKNQTVSRVVIPTDLLEAQPSALAIALPGVDGAEVSALAAYHEEPAGKPVQTKALLREAWVSYNPSTNFQVRFEDAGDRVTAIVKHLGTGFDAKCWDTNLNNQCDDLENKSGDKDGQGNPVCDVRDCFPSELSTLYVKFDDRALTLLPSESKGTTELGPEPQGINKKVDITASFSTSASYARVGITSPTNNTPLSANMDIARIVFQKIPGKTPTFAAVPNDRTVKTKLAVLDLEANTAGDFTIEQTSGNFSELIDAAFSPSGDRLALSVIQQARPTLLLTRNLLSSAGADKILGKAARVEGLSWSRVERFYACNWVGAYRDAQRGLYAAPLHGAVDEVKVYNYARSADAFRSEAERGMETLKKNHRDGQLGGPALTCNNDSLECPAYHVCEVQPGQTVGKCVVKSCNASDPYSCSTGQCTLAAMSDASGRELGWVCSAECNVDNECFRQQCMNGPCRFCDTKRHSCSECRPTVQDYGAFKVDMVEGCPDQNSFACQAGSCVSECYAQVNGQAKFLCDATTEYCKRGKCTLLDWDWPDLSPMTFSGVGESLYQGMRATVASPTLYPVEIEAYGVDDYGQAPEVIVEAKSNFVNRTNWFELGRVMVYNLTRIDAKANHYILQSPYPLTAIRFRLVTPPMSNLNAASTGFKERIKMFCHPNNWPGGVVPADCINRASGSRPNVGYAIGGSRREQMLACTKRGGCNATQFDPLRTGTAVGPSAALVDHLQSAPSPFGDLRRDPSISGLLSTALQDTKDDPATPFLMSGQPTVVISDLTVAGTSFKQFFANDNNRVCSYEGTLSPVEAGTNRRKRIWYGDIAQEQSNQKTAYFQGSASSTMPLWPAATKGWALLNCNMASPTNDLLVAGLTITVPDVLAPIWNRKPASNKVKETANGCLVDVGGGKMEPCFEMVGGDAVFDVMSAEAELNKTLDFNTYRSFGYPTEQVDAGAR